MSAAVLSGPFSDRLDIPCNGCRRRGRIPDPRRRGLHQPLSSGHDERPYRAGAYLDDVPAVGQGEVRGTGRRVP